MKNYTRRNWAIIALTVIALFTVLTFVDAQEWRGNYPTALVATGSNLEHQCVVDAAYYYDLILVTPYSYQFIKDIPELREKAVLFISYFSKSSYDGNNYGIYPNPKDAGNEEMRIIWDREAGWWSYGYAITDEWVSTFIHSVSTWVNENKPRGIMLDDHTLSHRWWNIDEDHYQMMHPEDLEEKMMAIDIWLYVALKRNNPNAILMLNGPKVHPTLPTVRYWEGCGRPYNDWALEVLIEKEPGDWFQTNDGPSYNWFLAGWAGRSYGDNPVALGRADGMPLWEIVDGEEKFILPLPKDYYGWEEK